MTDNLPAIAQLNRALASPYNAASTDDLRWKNEKVFFEAQIKKNWQVERAVRQGEMRTIDSLKLAARESASMGLSMSPALQLVYFIPRRARRRRDNETKSDYERTVPFLVTATPSYRGLCHIATHHAGARMCAAEVVFAADKFRYFGPIKEPEHEPTLDNQKRGVDHAIGAYAVVLMTDGSVRCEYTDAPTIARIRQLSDFPNALMWTKVWTEGWKKVPLRRIAKTTMNSAPRMAVAVDAMNRSEGIVLDGERGALPAPDTSEDEEPQQRPRGMAGLGAALNGSYRTVEPEELDAEPDPEPQETPQEEPADQSGNPPGSIEWWCGRFGRARDHSELYELGEELQHISDSEDKQTLRSYYKVRWQELQ